MKKTAIAFVALALLIFIGTVIITSRVDKPVADPATLLSADTPLYVVFPNLEKTLERWNETAITSLSRDPAVRPFLKRPAQRIVEDPGFQSAREILAPLELSQIFFCITEITEEAPGLLLGFRFDGAEEHASDALARLRRELNTALANGKAVVEEATMGGFSVYSMEVEGTAVITAFGLGWGLVSNDITAIADFIARTEGAATTPSLADFLEYQRVAARMVPGADFSAYVHVRALLGKVLEIVSETDAIDLPFVQFQQFQDVESAGFSVALGAEGTTEKQVAFGNWEGADEGLSNFSLPYAPEDTLFYASTKIGLDDMNSALLRDGLPEPLVAAMDEAGVDLSEFAEAFGNEYGAFGWWSQNALIPSFVASLKLEDGDAAKTLASRLVGMAFGDAVVTERDGATVFSFPGSGIGLLSPVLAFHESQALVALNPGDLATALETKQSGKNFGNSALLRKAGPISQRDTLQFFILDLPGLVERTYGTLQTFLPFAAAMSPDLAQVIDTAKLPEPEALTRYLSPVVSRQTLIPGGVESETKGAITFTPFLLGVVAGSRDGFSGIIELAE